MERSRNTYSTSEILWNLGLIDDPDILLALKNRETTYEEVVISRFGKQPPILDWGEYHRKLGNPLSEKQLINFLKEKIEDPQNCQVVGTYYLFKSTEDNPYEANPEDLLEGHSRSHYFVRRNGLNSRGPIKRIGKNGYWKSMSKKVIKVQKLQEDVKMGTRHRFVFYTGKSPKGIRTQYAMHEYHLDDEQYPTSTKTNDYWVLCEVFKDRRNILPKISEKAIVDCANACIDDGYDFSSDSDESQ